MELFSLPMIMKEFSYLVVIATAILTRAAITTVKALGFQTMAED